MMDLKDYNKIAVVEVQGPQPTRRFYGVRNTKLDSYIYPNNTTEFELVDEIEHLEEFYDGVVLILPLPPHIRHEVAIAAIPPAKNLTDYWSDIYEYV